MEHSHLTLLAASIRDRTVWDEFDASGETAKVPEDLVPFADAIRAYYANDPEAQAVNAATLKLTLVEAIRDPKRKAATAETLDVMLRAEVSVPNAREAVRVARTRRVSEALAAKLLIPSKDGPEQISALMDEYVGLQSKDEKDDAPQWSAEALAPAVGEARVPVYPLSLGHKMRGGLWPGHHMTVFARPEIGKSAFAINVAVMAASRGNSRVLYLSNEDSVRDLMLRTLVRFTGKTPEEVTANLADSVAAARRFGADRITFRDMSPGSLAEVERLVRRYKPDLLVVDQMRNMGTGQKGGENMTQRLDAIAQGLRNVGKRHDCAVLSVTQAGDSARDKAVLDDGDVDNSNTGISAGCDVLIGIGATPIMREAGERRLSIIKNKLGGMHGYADVRLDPITLAFRDRS